jgi:glyoxylase-like metal-dependent hydrolase (beta-lactamase superfamily II)
MLREGLVPAPTRRQLLQAGSAAALTLAIPRGPLRAQGEATAQPLGSNLFIVSAGGVNAVAQSGNGGALLVDGGSAATSRALLDIIAALPGGGPVHTLFNSHWHPEQTGSNLELGEAGATIIAQENTRLWLTTDIVYPWDDSRQGRVAYEVRGSAPRRRLVLSFADLRLLQATLQLIVYERTGMIQVRRTGQSLGDPTIRQLDIAQVSPSRANSARKIG